MASTGKTYKSHAATIRRWIADDRRKVQSLQDRYLYSYTFANDNGENPLMAKAYAYVDH